MEIAENDVRNDRRETAWKNDEEDLETHS